MRRRALFSKHPSGALYPFENGSKTFTTQSETSVTVTSGNHIYLNVPKVYYPGDGAEGEMINLSHISKNSDSARGQVNNSCINNQPVWFTIPAGAECTTKLRNVSIISGTKVPKMNFRIANTSLGPSPTLGVNPNSYETSGVLTADTSMGCFYAYIPENMTVEFDIEFYVNGERWI